jgi:hypothetical protein
MTGFGDCETIEEALRYWLHVLDWDAGSTLAIRRRREKSGAGPWFYYGMSHVAIPIGTKTVQAGATDTYQWQEVAVLYRNATGGWELVATNPNTPAQAQAVRDYL